MTTSAGRRDGWRKFVIVFSFSFFLVSGNSSDVQLRCSRVSFSAFCNDAFKRASIQAGISTFHPPPSTPRWYDTVERCHNVVFFCLFFGRTSSHSSKCFCPGCNHTTELLLAGTFVLFYFFGRFDQRLCRWKQLHSDCTVTLWKHCTHKVDVVLIKQGKCAENFCSHCHKCVFKYTHLSRCIQSCTQLCVKNSYVFPATTLAALALGANWPFCWVDFRQRTPHS